MKTYTGVFKEEMPSYATMRRVAISLDVTIGSISSVKENGMWLIYLKDNYIKGFKDEKVLD